MQTKPEADRGYLTWWTKAEAITFLKCSESTLERWVRSGQIIKRHRPVYGRKSEPVYDPETVRRVSKGSSIDVEKPVPRIPRMMKYASLQQRCLAERLSEQLFEIEQIIERDLSDFIDFTELEGIRGALDSLSSWPEADLRSLGIFAVELHHALESGDEEKIKEATRFLDQFFVGFFQDFEPVPE